jgi:neutral ceramidase
MRLRTPVAAAAVLALAALALAPLGCADPNYSRGPAVEADAGYAGPEALSVSHCTFETPKATAGNGGTVTAGAVLAGTAEVILDIPIGATLGAYASRANIGGNMPNDGRVSPVAGRFQPSIGIETAPRAKVLALRVGTEDLVLVKLDLGVAPDGLAYDVAAALGDAYAGKVVVATGHSHASWGHVIPNAVLAIGFGVFHKDLYARVRDQVVTAAQSAIAARVPAKIAVHHDGNFDPQDRVSRDRRAANDALMGGKRKDRDLFVLRVDSAAGDPLAVVPIFGVHGTVLDGDNNIISRETTGAIERAVEEAFDEKVLVMHLQGAAGDVSPAGAGSVSCGSGLCYDFARIESVGREARAAIMSAWNAAGTKLVGTTEMEVLTRSIAEGPDAKTFSIRNGALSYAPFDPERDADGVVYEADGKTIKTPIDEFNAQSGAALCGDGTALPAKGMPGVSELAPYKNCVLVPSAHRLIQGVLEQPVETAPLCATTRTVVSALRIGDFLIATLPGEPVTLLADKLRSLSPYPIERTAVVGYAQSHVGYLLTPEDWLSGGYEPSINVWGPLEGEHIVESAAALLQLATTPSRENAESGTRVVIQGGVTTPTATASATAGTVPTQLPEKIATRSGTKPDAAQPANVERLQTATFTFEGSSPLLGNPNVHLEVEENGTFVTLKTRSGRAVADGEVIVTYTPFPLTAKSDQVTNHFFVAEWQAVAPRGLDNESFAARTALPLGRYRFVAEGPGYTVSSAPFAVTAAALDVKVATAGASLAITTAFDATGGYRLLDDVVPSNGLVPARSRALTVRFFNGAAQVGGDQALTANNDGVVTVTAPSGANRVTVRDGAGNEGTATLTP